MNSDHLKDVGSTAIGGASGYGLLLSTKWELIPHGELLKWATAVLLIVIGYFAYRHRPPNNGAPA